MKEKLMKLPVEELQKILISSLKDSSNVVGVRENNSSSFSRISDTYNNLSKQIKPVEVFCQNS